MIGRVLMIILLFSLTANVYTQDEPDKPILDDQLSQKEHFDQVVDQLDFSDTKSIWKIKEKERIEKEEGEIESKTRTRSPGINFNGGFTNMLAYLLIILLVCAMIYMIFANVKVQTKIEQDKIDEDYIEDIEVVDTLDGFKQALNAGDYRSALRMQFIKVLQLLQENNDINWRPEKTNKDYLRELTGSNKKSGFRKLSSIYELVWYGNTKVGKENFEQLNPSFDAFINDFDGQ